jgi:hypothetical protein
MTTRRLLLVVAQTLASRGDDYRIVLLVVVQAFVKF